MLISGIRPLQFIYLLTDSLLLAYNIAMFYLIIGVISPILDWPNENSLLKGNPKLLLWIYSSVFFTALIAAPQMLLLGLNLSFHFIEQEFLLIFSLLLNLAISAVLTWIYYGPAKRKLSRFEVGA